MNILDYLISINKISIVAFVVTIGILIFEFRQLRKEKAKSIKPEIPQFDQSASPLPIDTQVVALQTANKNAQKLQYHKVLLIVLIVMVVFFGITSIIGLFTGPKKVNTATNGEVVVQEVKSAGIKVYDGTWSEIKDTTVSTVKPGDLLYIGVVTITGVDVDKARIRINEAQWLPEHTTEQFDQKHRVFYREYTIGSDEAKLSIEAQLHSKTDGWLSE